MPILTVQSYRCAPVLVWFVYRLKLEGCGIVDNDLDELNACFDSVGRSNIDAL